MRTEKHIVNKTYGGHQLSRYIDVYEVSANRCHSVPESGYKGTEATLVDEPAWNEKFSSYSITGATLTGNNFILNNDVTAKANYETAKNLTLQTDDHGTIAANRNSGFIGDQVTLSNTAATNYSFSGYTITGATLTGNKFNFIGNDVTAKANFRLTGTTYYTNNNTYSVQLPGIQAAPTSYKLTTNVDITPMNYAVVKYNITGNSSPACSATQGPYFTKYARDNFIYGMIDDYTVKDYAGAGTMKFIIDRNNKKASAFYNNNFLSAKTMSADLTGISALYWRSYGYRLSFSTIRIVGTTNYADAYNY